MGARSEKTIPSFLKNTAQNRRKYQDGHFKNKDIFGSNHFGHGELTIDSF